MTMNYDMWWDWVHNIRVSTEDLMREFSFAQADFEVVQKHPRIYGKSAQRKYEKAREKMLELIDWAIELSRNIDRAIEVGRAIPENQRHENYEHLMMRLEQAKESVAKVIDYARRSGLLTNVKDGLKTT
mgnify:CR=1 FL=1